MDGAGAPEAAIEWRKQVPLSARYGTPHFGPEDALGEGRRVFPAGRRHWTRGRL